MGCARGQQDNDSPIAATRYGCLGVARDQVEDKIPKALALATAPVRLWAPS
jgi:hypothetical protein